MPNSVDFESKLRDLTQRQCEILYWVCQGLTFKEVAVKIGYGEDLVTAEMSRIYGTLGLTQQKRNVKRRILENEICPLHRISDPETDCLERVIEINATPPTPAAIQEVRDDARNGLIPLKGALVPIRPSRTSEPPPPTPSLPGGLAPRPAYPLVAPPQPKGNTCLGILIGILATLLVLILGLGATAFTVGPDRVLALLQPRSAFVQTVIVTQPPVVVTRPPETVLVTQPPATVLVTQPALTPLPPVVMTVVVTQPAPTPQPTTIAIQTVVVTAPPPTSTSLPTSKPPVNPCTATGETVDLTGQVASDFPGTEVCIGSTVSSVIDVNTKEFDVYSIGLQAGQQVQFSLSVSGCVGVRFYNPRVGQAQDYSTAFSDGTCSTWTGTFTPAVSGTYYFVIDADRTGVVYTFSSKLTTLQVPGDQIASDLPGTILPFGTEMTSVIDQNTKEFDVYSVDLTAGQQVRFKVETSGCLSLKFLNPRTGSGGTTQTSTAFSDGTCSEWSRTFIPAVSGTYYLVLDADRTSIIYTVSVAPFQ